MTDDSTFDGYDSKEGSGMADDSTYDGYDPSDSVAAPHDESFDVAGRALADRWDSSTVLCLSLQVNAIRAALDGAGEQ